MTKLKQVYKCNVCGNIVEMLHTGAGELVCCGQAMELQQAKDSSQEGTEKHVPVVEKNGNKIKVTVGSVEHPMQDEHYIEWIEVMANKKVYRQHLNPGNKPIAEFEVESANNLTVREYCNLHGLWQA